MVKISRQKGSHRYYNKDGLTRPITIPFHSNKDLPDSVVHNTLKQLKLTIDDCRKLLK